VRRACIDIGSNTIRLLVADCDASGLVERYRERVFTRLGEALREDGTIPPEKLEEACAVVTGQLARARGLGATEIRCVATAAVRRARNGDELIGRLRGSCGLIVELLSAEDEARLAFRGALRSLGREPGGPVSVIDVGGGSSELVVGTPAQGVTWWTSFPLGSSDIARDFLVADPPSADDVEHARQSVRQALTGITPPPSTTAVAIGAHSLGRLVGPVLDADTFGSSLQLLLGSSRSDLASRLGLEVERLRLLPAGLLILEAVSKLVGTPLQVVSGGLREGILLDSSGS
jgi:exopolyphosphatase/guanosine-5'-triphosphate,3'-diphosphate pyrophosphatase